MKAKILAGFLFICCAFSAPAQQVRVAVAANAQFVTAALAEKFKKKTGIAIELVSGSSGKLAAQIENGAPFDVFLSADMEFPARLFDKGFGEKPRAYALGSLILCSRSKAFPLANWRNAVMSASVKKIAIANAAIAPYGKAAEEALTYYTLLDRLKPRLVYGESISQVNTYILTGAVSAGFTTEALVHEVAANDTLYWIRVPTASYAPIRQGALLVSKQNSAAKRFYSYLFSDEARAAFKKYGYRVR